MAYDTDTDTAFQTPLSPNRPRRFWAVGSVVVIILVALGFGLSSPTASTGGDRIFTIALGQGLKSVATELTEEGYVRSPLVFSTLVTFFGGERRLSPGDYYFPEGESVLGIARQIAVGDHNLDPIKVTVPEGETVREITMLLADKIPGFDTAAFAALASAQEGYLFPETYFFYPKATPAEVVKDMRAMFDRETETLFKKGIPNGRSKEDIIVMASLIEREAHGSDDRATIAGILYKRLAQGMRLQVDATIAYANGIGDKDLTKADFAVDSPYNTYTHGGLPPGPIANPGLEAIRAALNPAETAYLYYLHDKNGSIHYAKTYAEHQKNISAYLR